jgi:hypothetical protein
MACNMVKMAQNSAPYYGVMPSDPPQVPRPVMVSSLMVSSPLDQSIFTRPDMVTK